MDNREWPDVRKEAERQGWTVTDTKAGYALHGPDGGTIVFMDRLHRSSDLHALDQIVRRMRRAGFVWPKPKQVNG